MRRIWIMIMMLFFIGLTGIRIHEGCIANDTSIAVEIRSEGRYIYKLCKIPIISASNFIRFGYLLVLTYKRG